MRAEINSKHPDRTCWAKIHYGAAELPTLALLRDRLAEVGWVQDKFVAPSPVGDDHEVSFESPGTGLFNGWTDDENRTKLAALRKVLRSFRVKAVRHKLTILDLL